MSPHAVPRGSPDSDDLIAAELRKFSITSNGFLPEEPPLAKLPGSYYEPWESIAQSLPALIRDRNIHAVVGDLPVLSTDRLSSLPEWRRAYLLLAFITHAHIWGGDKPNEVLPPQITIPLLAVSAHLELPPTLTYAAVCLWNFSYSDSPSASSSPPSLNDLESLRSLISFTGTPSESWFSLISVSMEARASSILTTMLAALDAVKPRAYDTITSALLELARCIDSVSRLLERMYERCDPHVFYHQIRPFLAGTMNMQDAGLPRGVFYDRGGGKGEWRQLRGGSNGQSSLIQFFDVVLGVDHRGHGENNVDRDEKDRNSDVGSDATSQKPSACCDGMRAATTTSTTTTTTKTAASSSKGDSFHAQVREYMPGLHRRFLVHVTRLGSIRELALVPPATEEQRRLRAAYQMATDALARFRNKHIQIVTRYIIIPSRQQQQQQQQQNHQYYHTQNHSHNHQEQKQHQHQRTSSPHSRGSDGHSSGSIKERRPHNLASSSMARKGEELTGTGGTMLVPFLRQARDETIAAGKLER